MFPVSHPSQQAVQVPQLRDGSGSNALALRDPLADPTGTPGSGEGIDRRGVVAGVDNGVTAPWQCLYRLPLPQWQSSFRVGGIKGS